MSANPKNWLVAPDLSSPRRVRRSPWRVESPTSDRVSSLLDVSLFRSGLMLERKRAERSHKPFALMLLHLHQLLDCAASEKTVKGLVSALASTTRETDLTGWYEAEVVLGVIFTEIDLAGNNSVLEGLQKRIAKAIANQIGDVSRITITVHVFPEDVRHDSSGDVADAMLYPDLSKSAKKHRVGLAIKRASDVVMSAFLLVLLSPLFAAIAAAIKLGSKGPVFFRQERLGKLGVPFQCLKFRTMQVNNSSKVHQDFVQNFIQGKEKQPAGAECKVFKITHDPRVTCIGRLLRRTSLDELPQLWNVFVGNMSLVGPRPPVRYEYEMYDLWHRRRVLEVRPGITGLWQVSGRSRTRFDEMVRLDLRYSRSWSLWLDLVILLRTPRAVFSGDGAY